MKDNTTEQTGKEKGFDAEKQLTVIGISQSIFQKPNTPPLPEGKDYEQEIFKWLATKKYQTEREETGEYLMYFELDMPKIIKDYSDEIHLPAMKETEDKLFDVTENWANKYAELKAENAKQSEEIGRLGSALQELLKEENREHMISIASEALKPTT